MLTKRRAVDHCRVHSSLCRRSWRDVPPRAGEPGRPDVP